MPLTTLAIEQSCASGSVALREPDGRVTERAWEEESRMRNRGLFPNLKALLNDAGIGPEAIDRFAVGIGPGSFTGIRMAISAAWGMALPAGRQVVGFPSPDVLAADLAREMGAGILMIVGDARRERLWLAEYALSNGRANRQAPIRVIPTDKLADLLQPTTRVATSDWMRLADFLSRSVPTACTLLRETHVPRAQTLAEIACEETPAVSPAPPLPLYLHPAV